jgi:DNA-binding winged helix-turn-helix (wHTH) protein/tetratricopeptide (TPR) repeat protein
MVVSLAARVSSMEQPRPSGRVRAKFGVFEADLFAQELRKNGIRIKLQGQPFQVLAALLQRSGEVITREDLREKLWPADTFVDFDNGLNTAINKVREVLGDLAQNPRFIETLPRRGYRFIAPVEVLVDGSSNREQNALVSILNPAASASTSPKWKLPATAIGIALVVGLLAVVGSLFIHRRSGLTQKDTVVLADFANRTGDAIFDETLKQALAIELGQSPFLNILPAHSVRETLRYMGRSPDEQLTMATARELCERRGIKAMLTGSISSLGRNYVIALEARNCRTGESLAEQQVEVQGKEQVLRGLENAASKLRAQLGESLTSIQKFDAPFEQATTNSLEALQAYSLAQQQLARGADPAVVFLEHAIDLDPNFATAYGALGHIYAGQVGKHDLAIEYLQKAFQLRHRVSEREKFYITAEYYAGVTRDLGAAIDNYALWRRTYPRDAEPLDGLAATYNQIGQYERSVEYAQEAIPLRPDDRSSYGELVGAYLCLSRWKEAKATCEKAIAQRLDGAAFRWPLYTIAMIENDASALRQQVEWAKREREETRIRFFEAMAAAYSGKHQQFRQLFSQAIEMARGEYSTGSASVMTTNEAIVEALLGYPKRARDLIASVQPIPLEGEESAALALALAGDADGAERLINDLEKRYPHGTLLKVLLAPTVRAVIEISRNNANRAIVLLQITEPYERARLVNIAGLLPIYLRGKAYLQLSAGVEAAREFQKIVDNRGVASRSTLQALARCGLARAYALQGEKAKSRATYQEFFTLWKDADSDIPALEEAKAEYAKLRD